MDYLQPASWAEALALRAQRPDAVPVAGGTDVMVGLNFDRHRPAALLDLSRLRELTGWERDGDHVRLGAAEPYTRIVQRLRDPLPALAQASRTVGSPQIRNRGSVGGNLGSASPAGDAHPPLLAAGATVEAASVRGTRLIPAAEFFTGVKANALAPDELIAAVRVPVARGPQRFAKIGTRNAMVIAVCSFAVALDLAGRRVGTGVGSAAPTPRRATAAEEFAAGELEAAGLWDSRGPLPGSLARRFGQLVADAASPVDDVRGTAAYRRHALSVIARRTLTWAWAELRKETSGCGCHAM
ncbi:FAD binding domain-containing protein [Actinomadura kijaniata]|uniref:FAD binding domain-containing protein n=1 Tax=Actinomadura kijaniata TaxID=46161 RepID=UPI000835DD4D|nr:FAD binding domain-containing protein [Actinomadura kijaniata]